MILLNTFISHMGGLIIDLIGNSYGSVSTHFSISFWLRCKRRDDLNNLDPKMCLQAGLDSPCASHDFNFRQVKMMV